MNWIKIKGEHISQEYTDAMVGSLVRYQILVARLGRLPTEKEVSKETSIKTIGSLKEVMRKLGATLEQVGRKVLEDHEEIQSKREEEKFRKRKYRENLRLSHGTAWDSPIVDKIREDKIREYSTASSIKTDGTTANKIKNIIKKYQDNIGTIGSQTIKDKIHAWCNEFSESEIYHAIDESVVHNVLKASYIDAILKNKSQKPSKNSKHSDMLKILEEKERWEKENGSV